MAQQSVEPQSSKSRVTIDGSNRPLPKWHSRYTLIPIVLALITSINALWNGFVFDDISLILNNDFIKDIRNVPLAFVNSGWANLADSIWASDSYFRPLFIALLTLDYQVFGTQPWGWHLVNILIHSGVTFLVFIVCREVTGREWLSIATAGLFAVHPVHSESVAWASGITDPLMAIFVLLAFYLYLRYRTGGGKYLMAITLALYLAALLSKETAIVLPILIAYCELVHFRDTPSFRRRAQHTMTFAALFALPISIYLVMRHQALGNFTPKGGPRYLLDPVLLNVPLVAVKYLWLMLVPVGYSLQHYIAPLESINSIAFFGPVILIFVIGAPIVWLRSSMLSFAAAWFALWILLPLGALRVLNPLYFVQERYLYLPSVGFCLAIALALEWLWTRRIGVLRGRVVSSTFGILLITVWSGLLIRQNAVWRDPLSLSKNAVEVDPTSAYAHSGLAATYFAAGNLRSAEDEAKAAIVFDRMCMDAHLNLSYVHETMGNIQQAIKDLELAKVLAREGAQNSLGRIHRTLGRYYESSKDLTRAEENYRLAVEVTPYPYPPNSIVLADFYFAQKRYQDAREILEGLLPYVPDKFAIIHLKLGRVYDRLGLSDRARSEYERYLTLVPPTAKERNEVIRRLRDL